MTAGDFAALAIPPLLIRGAGDPSAPLAAVRSLVASLPGVRMAVLAGDHHLALRWPEAVAGRLTQLLDHPAAVAVPAGEVVR